MKKFFALLMAALLAIVPLAVFAEDTEMLKPFEGLVTEVVEGGFLMEDANFGQLLVNVDDNTVLDGILSIQPIEPGMYVLVDHNGMMTRSIPAQVYAQRVGCYTLNGVADQITEEGVLLTGDPIFGDVFVQMSPTKAVVFPGAPMLVYYDGVMTMSLPGKVNARYVVVPEVTGIISENDGAGFTLTDEEGNTYRILTSDQVLTGELAPAEENVVAEEVVVEHLNVPINLEEADGAEAEEEGAGEAAETGADAVVTEAEDAAEAGDTAVTEAGDAAEAGEAVVTEAGDAAEAAATESEEATEAGEAGDAEASEAAEAETAADAESAEPAVAANTTDESKPVIRWNDGDTVTVYHQGPMEAEAGAELVALGLLIHR
ncbi:MAG: hypothetical protein IJ041_04885 [Clostridia bacterium]|nr:hypothetical protein [Clostridia bacterium]